MAGAPAPKSLLLYSQRFSRQGLHGEALAGFLIPSDLLPGSAATAVVLDTNVVLAWWVFEDPRTRVLAQALQDHRLHWLATEPMLDELRHVLCRPLPHRWEASREHALTFEPRAWATTVAVPGIPVPATWGMSS